MVEDTMSNQPGLELATFGEVLYAFSALRATSGRRRGGRVDSEILPWQDAAPIAPVQRPAPPIARRITAHSPRPMEASPKPSERPRRGASRCHCGQCRNCVENARWERIFQEKFASSDYYSSEIRIRYSSPLASV
ncbi:MAG: hypothetical protein U0Q18_28285 [Bryobacteraceae bacterium]